MLFCILKKDMEDIDTDDESNYYVILDQVLDSEFSGMDDNRSIYSIVKPDLMDMYRNPNGILSGNYFPDLKSGTIQYTLRNLVYDNDIDSVEKILQHGVDPNSIPVILSFDLSQEMYSLLKKYGLNPFNDKVDTYNMWPWLHDEEVTYEGQIAKRKEFVDNYLSIFEDEYKDDLCKSLNLIVNVNKPIVSPELLKKIKYTDDDLALYNLLKASVMKEYMKDPRYPYNTISTNNILYKIANGQFDDVIAFVENEVDPKMINKMLSISLFYEKFEISRYLLSKNAIITDSRDIIRFLSNFGLDNMDISKEIINDGTLAIDTYYLHNTKCIELLIEGGLFLTNTQELVENNRNNMYGRLIDKILEYGMVVFTDNTMSELDKEKLIEIQNKRRKEFIEDRQLNISSILNIKIDLLKNEH